MEENSYDSAYNELQTILEKISADSISIDELSAQIKRAAELIDFCKKKLRSIEQEVETHLNPAEEN